MYHATKRMIVNEKDILDRLKDFEESIIIGYQDKNGFYYELNQTVNIDKTIKELKEQGCVVYAKKATKPRRSKTASI